MSAEIPGQNNLYCQYDVARGVDWEVLQGVDTGISQTASKASGGDQCVVWNFPIDLTFKSTSAHGWPRLVLSVFGRNGMGMEVVRGYGSCLIPTAPGVHTRYIRLFAPVSASLLQQFLAYVTGEHAQFFDPKFVATSEGREVTRVQSSGVVKVQINVTTVGMESYGFV